MHQLAVQIAPLVWMEASLLQRVKTAPLARLVGLLALKLMCVQSVLLAHVLLLAAPNACLA